MEATLWSPRGPEKARRVRDFFVGQRLVERNRAGPPDPARFARGRSLATRAACASGKPIQRSRPERFGEGRVASRCRRSGRDANAAAISSTRKPKVRGAVAVGRAGRPARGPCAARAAATAAWSRMDTSGSARAARPELVGEQELRQRDVLLCRWAANSGQSSATGRFRAGCRPPPGRAADAGRGEPLRDGPHQQRLCRAVQGTVCLPVAPALRQARALPRPSVPDGNRRAQFAAQRGSWPQSRHWTAFPDSCGTIGSVDRGGNVQKVDGDPPGAIGHVCSEAAIAFRQTIRQVAP